MEWLTDFGAWAWERHHNMLSWYIRPLFLLPFVLFAYRRSLGGIVLTLVALATSMFWFPAPAEPDPRAVEFLAMEKEYLTGEWTWWKIALTLTVPFSFVTLALAFWKRSLLWGLVVINAMALGKIVWSFVFGDVGGGLAVVAPAVVGLVICNAVILLAAQWLRGRRTLSRMPG